MKISPLVSVVVPFYNEQETITEIHQRLKEALLALPYSWEFIFVDDGSCDRTFAIIKTLKPVIAIRLRKNFGQTQALAAGIAHAHGEIIVTMDGDLENDPADIPLLLTKLEEGYDIVSGWRKERWKNKWVTRRFPSALANLLISWVSGIRLSDHGCTLKAYRRWVLDSISLAGEMHRMIAAYAAREGARVLEIPIRFEPRRFGKSNYGLSRTFKVLLDILALHFFHKYAKRPIHFFGGIGFFSFFISAITFFVMMYYKYFGGKTFIETPLPVLTTLFVIIGFQFILMGLLAEIVVRLPKEKYEQMEAETIINQ